jgi:hypothetical protein
MKVYLLTFLLLTVPVIAKGQFLIDSQFQIYRGWVSGAIVQIRFDSGKRYEMQVEEFHCSLCDHDEISNAINSTGKWSIEDDVIILYASDQLHVAVD